VVVNELDRLKTPSKTRTCSALVVRIRTRSPGNNEVRAMSISHAELHRAKPLTVTVAMAREISGLGNTTIWALIKAGKLESTRVGTRRLVIYRSLERLLSPSSAVPSPQPRRRPPARAQSQKELAPEKAVQNSTEGVT